MVSTAKRRPGIVLGHAIPGALLAVAGMVGFGMLVSYTPLSDWDAQLTAVPAFVLVGSFILVRSNVPSIGWLVGLIGLTTLWISLDDTLDWGVLGNSDVFVSPLILISLLFLVFPTGRPPIPRLRGILWLGLLLEAICLLTVAVNRQCEPDQAFTLWCLPFQVVFPAAIALFAFSIGGLILRYRGSGGVERLQLKWFVTSVLAFAVVATAGELFGPADPTSGWIWNITLGVGVLAIPVSIAFSIMRFRLYEIDRIVSRTVTYALTIILLGGLYAIVAYLPGFLVIGLGGSSPPLLVAGSTLAAAAAFNPLRRRIRRRVDRRFNRSHYDAERVIEEFTGSLRHQIDPDTVLEGWVGVVSVTMEPSTTGVWMRT